MRHGFDGLEEIARCIRFFRFGLVTAKSF